MNALKGRFFVTGTDTEVGKTWVSCRLLEQAAAEGHSCYGLKPVAAGCQQTDQGPRNDDALELMAASSVKLAYEQVNPVALNEAVAPHIAAFHENRRMTVSGLAGYVKGAMMTRADLVLVEGAGGWRVPINDHETLADLARELALPVILVVAVRLGCINHALLSAQAIRNDGLQLAGWVANLLPGQETDVSRENIVTLEHWLPAPRIAVV